jgi:hypothetical protein
VSVSEDRCEFGRWQQFLKCSGDVMILASELAISAVPNAHTRESIGVTVFGLLEKHAHT